MSINGIDVTTSFSMAFGTIWIIGYFGFVLLVIGFHSKNIKQRRWKAALFIGGLPVLGMPLLLSVILLLTFLFQAHYSNFSSTTLFDHIQNWFVSIVTISAYFFPFSVLMAIPATFGTYGRLQAADTLLNKIVPPSADEKPNVHEYM